MSLCLGLSTHFLCSLLKKMTWSGLDFSVDVFLLRVYFYACAQLYERGRVQSAAGSGSEFQSGDGETEKITAAVYLCCHAKIMQK